MSAYITCGWCILRVQGCRCTTPCGADLCGAAATQAPAERAR